MTQIINPSDIEHLSETELLQLHARILDDLIRSRLTLDESPLVALSLHNIKQVLDRRKIKPPKL